MQSGRDAEWTLVEMRSGRSTPHLYQTALCSSSDYEQISGLEIAESSAVFGPEIGLRCIFESNWPTRSLPRFKIAILSTGLRRELEALTQERGVLYLPSLK